MYSQTFVSRRIDCAVPWARRPRSMAQEDGSGRRRPPPPWTRCHRRRVRYRRRCRLLPLLAHATTDGAPVAVAARCSCRSFAVAVGPTTWHLRPSWRPPLDGRRRFAILLCPCTVYLQERELYIRHLNICVYARETEYLIPYIVQYTTIKIEKNRINRKNKNKNPLTFRNWLWIFKVRRFEHFSEYA